MENALTVVEQKEVAFYADQIVAVKVEDGTVYVPIRPICDNLGVTLAGQRERINRDPVLAQEATSVSVTLTQQARRMLCLPLKYIPGWLFGINPNRVKSEIREKVILYQRECYDVLYEAVQEGRLSIEPNLDFEVLLQLDSPAAQAYKIAAALMHMAKQQLLLENRVEAKFQEYDSRLETIEATLGDPARNITPAQASQLSQAVKAVAMQLSKQNKRNEYGGVYGELYRRFEITSYKLLPRNRFEEAMKFLTEWYQQVANKEVPF